MSYRKEIPILQLKSFNPKIKEDFYVNNFKNHLDTFHKNITKPHNHDFYLTVLFTEGTGKHSIDFQDYEIKPGTIFFLSPGQTHHWEFTSEPQGYIFFHSDSFYQWGFPNKKIGSYSMFHSVLNIPSLTLNQDQTKQLKNSIETLFTEYQKNDLNKVERVALLMDLFYIDVSRMIQQMKHKSYVHLSYDAERFQQLNELIRQNFRAHKPVSFYADQLNLSTRHLNRIVSKISGKSISDTINEIMIHEANVLLLYSDISIKEISFKLGYEDTSYFIRFYKNRTQTTPAKFRKSVQ